MKAPGIRIVSSLWSLGSKAARKAVEQGLLKPAKLGARVISVGNLQAGGSGKTPVVARIAREACARGLKTCILSRGYRSQWENSGGVIEPGMPAQDPSVCGDEPALLHELVPQAWIGVGADRVGSFRDAEARLGSRFDLVILDDGFQHWKIAKDLEVLVLTSAQWGERLFRDRPEAARRADLIVWTKGSVAPESFGKPCARVSYRLKSPATKIPLWIVCGVGDPESVSEAARLSGLQVSRQVSLGDHASYSRGEIDLWLKQAREAGCQISVTGKDWVKWKAQGVSEAEVLVLEPELDFLSGRGEWERVLWS